MVDEDDAATQALADKLLLPLAPWAVGPTTRRRRGQAERRDPADDATPTTPQPADT